MTARNLQLLINKPAGARDDFADPKLTGWTFESPLVYSCDGDVLQVELQDAPVSDGKEWTKNITTIDCADTYKFAVVRFKLIAVDGTISCYLKGSSGGDKSLCDESTETEKWIIKVLDATSMGTDKIWFYIFDADGGGSMKVAIDLVLFTTENPFYTDEDLDDIFDIPSYRNGVNKQTDFLQLVIDNHNGEKKDKFAYRDEVYLWLKKNGDYYRRFGGSIDVINPNSVAYGREYITLNCLGWSALLYERNVTAIYEDEAADEAAKDIIDLAHKQHALNLTTFGIKDVQRNVPVLKCDYDSAFDKLVELAEQLDCITHVEPNRDVSLYPRGMRFLRYAGWMEHFWEKGWGCTAKEYTKTNYVAKMSIDAGGSGTLYRVTPFSVDSSIFPRLLLELKGDGSTKCTIKIETEDDTEYIVKNEFVPPANYEVLQLGVLGLITGSNKNVKNVKLLISNPSSAGELYVKWLGFFPAICSEPIWKFDMGTATSPVESGYTQVEGTDIYSEAVGWGWDSSVVERDREAPDDLRRDLHQNETDRIFTADVENGQYKVVVIIGDNDYAHDDMDVSINDVLVANDIDTAAAEFKEFYFYIVVTDGQIEIKFHDDGGIDLNWIVNAVRIERLMDILDCGFGDKVTLDATTNVKAGTFLRDPKKARNCIIVKGDKFEYDVPLEGDFCEKGLPSTWGANDATLTADQDAHVGTKCLKAVLNLGTGNEFIRKSSGLVSYDDFDTFETSVYDEGQDTSQGTGDGDAIIVSEELNIKLKLASGGSFAYWIVTKTEQDVAGRIIEAKIKNDANAWTSDRLVICKDHSTSVRPYMMESISISSLKEPAGVGWYIDEYDGENKANHHYIPPSGTTTRVVKVVLSETMLKVYFDNVLVCNVERITTFTEGYLYLYASTNVTEYQYPKADDLKVYKGLKIYVESLNAGWKVEMWSGTYASPGSKVAEATVPEGSTIAELDVHDLTFPFTGFFKVFDPTPTEDHHSDDYSDIWGGDVYTAKQTTEVEHVIYYPATKDLKMNALALKRLELWLKHDAAMEGARLLLATDDQNYYYTDFNPVTKWKEKFKFNVGFMQNIEFETVGSPKLSEINYVGFLYPATSTVNEVKIDGMHFVGETEAWGVARDEDSINEIGFQPEKVFSSSFKTQADAQLAADYFLSILKQPPLIQGSVTHPWGIVDLHAGDSAIVNVPNQDVNNEELNIKEIACSIPIASSIIPLTIDVAGLPHALTDPQKRMKEWIDRLEKADVYADKIESFVGPLRDGISITDALSVMESYLIADSGSFTDTLKAEIEGKLTDTFSIVDYVQCMFIIEEFSNMNDWTSRVGTWSVASSYLQETGGVLQLNICEYTGTPQFPVNYFVEFVSNITEQNSGGKVGMMVRWDGEYADDHDGYLFCLSANDDKVSVWKAVDGGYTELANASKTIGTDTDYKLKVSMQDENSDVRFKFWFEDESSPCINYLESPKTQSDGKISFITYDDKGKFDYLHLWTE